VQAPGAGGDTSGDSFPWYPDHSGSELAPLPCTYLSSIPRGRKDRPRGGSVSPLARCRTQVTELVWQVLAPRSRHYRGHVSIPSGPLVQTHFTDGHQPQDSASRFRRWAPFAEWSA